MDWSRSRAVAGNFPLVNAWVNLRGRDPEGIVEPGEEYEEVQSQIIDLLYSIEHDKHRPRPVALALRKEEAEFLGQWGGRVGDVVLYWNSPYAEAGISGILPDTFHPDFQPDYYPFRPFADCPQAEHDPYLPWATYRGLSNSAVLIMAGPGVKKGYRRPRAVNLVDVAPTVSHLTGLPLPRDCEGKIVVDATEPVWRGREG